MSFDYSFSFNSRFELTESAVGFYAFLAFVFSRTEKRRL
ncbi:hypothetical protein HMPREF9953_0897 [Haemophilus parainfluenzae ATCC 33392]|uniref:Uncharacterized protein n=1 Tax=Haemophilus parainfluenzae HK2019 TaxID=1095746 RepID=A0ABN0ETN2_HAEPA|nr:hypothetical protein HMPREF1119_1402 [Haemophilus parainfluenzae HK2019]KFL98454.1 hypothetical protein HMPREF9953_0897 [Haemophilus parainfluenzae ATCC 33392]